MNRDYMKKLLSDRGLNIYNLAEALDSTRQTAYNLMQGRKMAPTMEDGARIKLYLKLNNKEFKELFGDEKWFKYYK